MPVIVSVQATDDANDNWLSDATSTIKSQEKGPGTASTANANADSLTQALKIIS